MANKQIATQQKGLSLTKESLRDSKAWKEAGFLLPTFNVPEVKKNTSDNPVWIHFGAGNIFRGFPAVLQQKLLDSGIADKGVIAVEGFDFEIISKIYKPYDNMHVVVTLKSDGAIEKRVVTSITESLVADKNESPDDWNRLESIFTRPTLQMASFTITEKGYTAYRDVSPEQASTLMEKITLLCLKRYNAGAYPIALVSMDNCSHNGSRLYDAVHTIATRWEKSGVATAGFSAWLEEPSMVSFPWSMIDKITPRPDITVKAGLQDSKFSDTDITVTAKNTWIAPFVNTEETGYLVIEDSFPNGRPQLEKAGVMFTDRTTVDRVERMKVCTCLNPLHTALAVFGCLLGYTSIHNEMHDGDLVRLITRLGYKEGLPVVTDPGIINPESFIREVIEIRLPNPFIPDTPQRIVCDTSQKIPVRFGETLKAYVAQQNNSNNVKALSISDLTAIPLVFAGWIRYLLCVDDSGNTFEPGSDPLMSQLREIVSCIPFGQQKTPDFFADKLKPLLSNKNIWGVDLFEVGLASLVCQNLSEMTASVGAVRRILQRI